MSAEKLHELKTLASVCPELNMANYTEDDVRHLNDWAIEMSLLVERYTLSQQPATSEPVAWKYQPQDGLKHPAFTEHEAIAIAHGKDGSVVPLYTGPVPSVPDGYALVPIEPTQEMLLAYTGGAVTNAGFRWCRHQWSAMLAAAAPAAHQDTS